MNREEEQAIVAKFPWLEDKECVIDLITWLINWNKAFIESRALNENKVPDYRADDRIKKIAKWSDITTQQVCAYERGEVICPVGTVIDYIYYFDQITGSDYEAFLSRYNFYLKVKKLSSEQLNELLTNQKTPMQEQLYAFVIDSFKDNILLGKQIPFTENDLKKYNI